MSETLQGQAERAIASVVEAEPRMRKNGLRLAYGEWITRKTSMQRLKR